MAAYEFIGEDDHVDRWELIANAWRLASITERSGYKQSFIYDAAGLLTTVSDSFGRSATITFEPPSAFPWPSDRLISSIQINPSAYRIDFAYERQPSTSPLVFYIAETRLKTVTVPGSQTLNATTNYKYEVPNDPFLLTEINAPEGVTTVTYDSFRRVTNSQHAGGNDGTTLSYDDPNKKVTVTNALNKSAIITYTTLPLNNLMRRPITIEGQPSPNCPYSSAAIGYDSNGRITQTTDEEGRITKYIRNTRGLPTSLTRGFNTPQAVTTTFAYHPTLHVPTQIVEPGLTTNYAWSSGQLQTLSQTDTTTGTVPYSTSGQTRTWTYSYVPGPQGIAGLLALVDGPLAGASDTVGFTYDVNGSVKTITNELGQITTVNFTDQRGRPGQITDENGVVTDLGNL